MFLPTASALARGLACQYPYTSGLKWQKGESNPAADFGNALHKCAEHLANGTPFTVQDIADELGLSPTDSKRLGRCALRVSEFIESEDQ